MAKNGLFGIIKPLFLRLNKKWQKTKSIIHYRLTTIPATIDLLDYTKMAFKVFLKFV